MTINRYAQKIRVGLVQINNSFSGQSYLPLSVGMLQAYAQKNLKQPDAYEFLLPVFSRMPVKEAVQKLTGVNVAFFSTYVWNFRISVEIAMNLKLQAPDTIVVFGGPHVPDRVEDFLEKHSFIDILSHGEGEQTGLAILENYFSRNWASVPGISYLGDNGCLVQNPKLPRMKELSIYPSPFLEGVFAPLMEAYPEEKWMALWETNRGCPFSCTFCDWGSAVQAKVNTFDIDRLYKELDWFAEHKIGYVYCCDANFGLLPRDVEIAKYAAEITKKYGYPNRLSVFNTKNATERAYQVQKIFSDAGLHKGVDIALQSVDEKTLEIIKRKNISLDTYYELQQRFTKEGVATYSEMILGLPGETYESFADGISTVVENGQHNRIRFGPLSILPNAEMGDPEYQKKYGMVTVESKATSSHGSLNESQDEVYETQLNVVATNSMPKGDWVRTRAFSIMTALLHFDKLLQIPFILINKVCSVSYRELIETFTEGSLDSFPTIAELQLFNANQARDLQNGGPEFVGSEELFNMLWPADEYMLIRLCVDNKLNQFYEDAEKLLNNLLRDKFLSLPPDLLHEAIVLNKGLLKQPFQTEDLDLDLSYNIWEFYQATLIGDDVPIEQQSRRYHIDRSSDTWLSWDDWCREVVWYGNSTGAYFYGKSAVKAQLAGHS